MFRPVSTLNFPKKVVSELKKSACYFVEDIKNSEDWAHKFDEETLNPLPATASALDLWQEEVEQDKLTTLCTDLDNILEGGIQYGSIVEICGSSGSGKTQICMQLSVTVQLPKKCGGFDGEVLYIDSRSGFTASRVQDIIRGCQKLFPEERINEDDILDGIKVSLPQTPEDILSTIHALRKYLRTDSKIKLVIIDSLSLPVQCAFENGWERAQFYFKTFNELQKIIAFKKIAVVIVNELCSHIDAEGRIGYESSGGQMVAHRVQKKLLVARLDDYTFAARLLKAQCLPQISIKFQIVEDGVRNQEKDSSMR